MADTKHVNGSMLAYAVSKTLGLLDDKADVADVEAVQAALNGKEESGAAATALSNANSYTDAAISNIQTQLDNKVSDELTKGTESNSTETLTHGGTFTAVTDTSVSGHTITDNTVTFTLPSETTLSTGSATSTGTLSHGGTFTAITGVSVSGHKITPTTTTYTLPSDNNTDTKVTQTVTTTDADYPLLTAATASKTATSTEGARFASGVTVNPADKSITATTFIGDLTGNADTATSAESAVTATTASTATKLGSSTVGGTATPIYLNAGTATAFSSTIGNTARPVYVSSGAITACSSTVGSGVKPVYMSSGTVTVSSSTVGGVAAPVYMNAGTITACSVATEDDIIALFA